MVAYIERLLPSLEAPKLVVSGDSMLVSKCVRSCAAAFGVMIVAGPVLAADYYGNTGGYGGYKDPPMTAPVTNWAGFYLGPSFGWSWSRVNAANNALILTNTGSVPFSHPGTNGMIGGGQLGYNVQSANFVYGIEADFGGLDVGAHGSRTDISSGKTFSVTSKAGFYGDVTGRGGRHSGQRASLRERRLRLLHRKCAYNRDPR